MGITFNLGLLGTFKYLPGVAAMWEQRSGLAASVSHLVLPVGISFWTFQALSYLFDVYREEKLDPTLVEFCLYMAFWPTVFSGPICRLCNLLPQFRERYAPTLEDIRTGANRICTGLFMMALAQTIAVGLRPGEGVNAAFSAVGMWSGLDVWCAAIAYGFQVFLDFAGYSHIAIGAARAFGFRLEENFERPYLSTTASIFWTRWHMSLSFWIRDYLFLPLARMRREMWWRNTSLLASMLVFGIWHKASLPFVVWGAYEGVLLVLHRQWQQQKRRIGFNWPAYLATPISWITTFAAICMGWIFFRANDLKQAATMWAAVLRPASYAQHVLPASLYVLTAVTLGGYFATAGLTSLWARDRIAAVRLPFEIRLAAYAVAFYFAMFHAVEPQGFIYFQF